MNDLLEYENGNKEYWDKLHFASFMGEEDESIGMWSMYSCPWCKGAKITINSKVFRNWIKATSVVYLIKDEKIVDTISVDNVNVKLWISSVVYCGLAKHTNSGKDSFQYALKWSNQKNFNFKKDENRDELTGYIKDDAWLYEKEIRIKCQFSEKVDSNARVAVPINENVIDSMFITIGPLFSKTKNKEYLDRICYKIPTIKSKFNPN